MYFPGFMVGREAEAGGMAKHGAKMLNPMACAKVFQFILLLHGHVTVMTYMHCPGFMVCREAGAGGIAKHGAKMVTVVACPKGLTAMACAKVLRLFFVTALTCYSSKLVPNQNICIFQVSWLVGKQKQVV